MEILGEKELANNIFKKYTSNPRNWSFIISTNPMQDGFFDAAITNSDEAWQLKIDSIYKPSPIITGAKLDSDVQKVKKTFNSTTIPFGYRKIDPPMFVNLFKKITEEQIQISKGKTDHINIELNSILNSLEPTVPMKGTDYFYGPFLYTNKNIVEKNTPQKNAAEKLSINMKKVIKERYPVYG